MFGDAKTRFGVGLLGKQAVPANGVYVLAARSDLFSFFSLRRTGGRKSRNVYVDGE